MHIVTYACGANLGPIGQYDLTFWLGNKQFTDGFIVLKELHINAILGLNWQHNYRISCNWNVNGQQYISHNNKFLCTRTPSSNTKSIIQNSGSFILPTRSISVISVQAPTELNTRHLYQLDVTGDLPPGIIPLAVICKIDHKYPKLLQIPLLNTEHNSVHILGKTITGKLLPIDVTDLKVSNISWTTDGTATANKATDLPCMPPKSSFQPEHSNTKHSIVLQDSLILQEAKDCLSSLLEGE